ncbi:MAG: sulfotransferase domain-containing protein, partial [Acidobacteria bacterium]|nr:sulfotransferase domain-containing protein [Acidobacteriota bacterium]
MTITQTLTRPASLREYQQRQREIQIPIIAESIRHGLTYQVQPSDLFISPYGKCGTTWLQQIVHSLRTRGDMEFDDISRVVPWLEMAHRLGLDL